MSDLTAIVTVLGIFLSNAAMIIPLFLWMRAEARAEARQAESKLEATRELIAAIHEEMKDFHLRLIKLERKKVADWNS